MSDIKFIEGFPDVPEIIESDIIDETASEQSQNRDVLPALGWYFENIDIDKSNEIE